MASHSQYILVSGVNISGTPSEDSQSPYPDYMVLRHALNPIVIDPTTVKLNRHLLVRASLRWLGPCWAIALATLLSTQGRMYILATGEDVGLRIALLAKLLHLRLDLSVTCHNIATRRSRFFLRYLRVGTAVQQFKCLSQSQANRLLSQYSIPKDKVQLLLWHVDSKFFRPDKSVSIKRQICSAGMASRDYKTLVEATRGLEVHVRIAADSAWYRQRLDIQGERLPDNVDVGSCGNYAALRRVYAESLIIVVPLYDVPFSAGYSVILEAMAMGKPVIATYTRQVDDFIVDGVTGYHVPPGDVGALREKIVELLNNPETAAQLGANARTAVEQHYTLAHFAERMGIGATA